jgi:hypothetical protein
MKILELSYDGTEAPSTLSITDRVTMAFDRSLVPYFKHSSREGFLIPEKETSI